VRVYLLTPLPNPHFPPEVCVRTCVLNFTINLPALDQQLLHGLVEHEVPGLSDDLARLAATSAANTAQLREIEARVLSTLAGAAGALLDDDDAIATLGSSRTLAAEIEAEEEQVLWPCFISCIQLTSVSIVIISSRPPPLQLLTRLFHFESMIVEMRQRTVYNTKINKNSRARSKRTCARRAMCTPRARATAR
jgi:hypothetical protein